MTTAHTATPTRPEPPIGDIAEQILRDAPTCNCPRCGNEFVQAFFYRCGGCLGDMQLANVGKPPIHFNSSALAKAGAA